MSLSFLGRAQYCLRTLSAFGVNWDALPLAVMPGVLSPNPSDILYWDQVG